MSVIALMSVKTYACKIMLHVLQVHLKMKDYTLNTLKWMAIRKEENWIADREWKEIGR